MPAPIPTNPREVCIIRQEHGWSVFYRDDRYDLCLLYEKCTLQEAGNVAQEFWDTGEISEATRPEHCR